MPLETGGQAKGAHGTYTTAEKLHRDNVWRAVQGYPTVAVF